MPHRFRLPALAGLVLACVLALGLSSASQTSADPLLETEEQAFVTLINNYRQQNGLGPLAIDWKLQSSSDWMSAEMGVNAYFDHYDHCTGDCVNGHQYDATKSRDPWVRMCNFGYCYNTWKGENIAGGYTTAAAVFQGWKNSPGHNANMLGPNYTVMGISRVYVPGSPYSYYWTNDFGGVQSGALPPGGATTTPTPTPTVPPTPPPTPVPTATPAPTQVPSTNCGHAAPSSLVQGDTDCDGFPDSTTASGRAPESRIGTDPTRACPATSTENDESGPDAWPMDLNDDGAVNGQDLGKFAPAYNKRVSQGPFGPDAIPGSRLDLNGDGYINGRDTGKFQTFMDTLCA